MTKEERALVGAALVSLLHEAEMYKQGTRTRSEFVEGAKTVLNRVYEHDEPQNVEFWNDLIKESKP